MPIVLSRVDDRLIHGQVVIGWGRPLGVKRIVLVDEEVAANPWEQDLYRMAVPEGIDVVFSSVADAAPRLNEWRADARRTLLLAGDVRVMAQLFAADPAAIDHINLGGIHHRPGRTERLAYLYLTDAELSMLQALESQGVDITAQDVPSAPQIGLGAIR